MGEEAVSGSKASNAKRRAVIASASQFASERKYCSRCTGAASACTSGSRQRSQRLGPVAPHQQGRQILAQASPLNNIIKNRIELHRKNFQGPGADGYER
ncbi:hypothetical protein AAKU55_005500 [Oxalobacteraceae bacterium GrIS 1.11]